MTVTGVVTVAAGRHEHLARQYAGLRRGSQIPDLHVVVAMGDPGVAEVAGMLPSGRVLACAVGADGLPLAAARNAGAAAALDAGADLLVFLDVDCIPGEHLVQRYAEAARRVPGRLLAGPVHYLPPSGPGGYDVERLPAAPPHPGRPAPPDGVIEPAADLRLFWSSSFALDAGAWKAVGGFSPSYTGYGAEDTDFAQKAGAAGVGMTWVGGASAYHQHHPVSHPPVEHLDDILRNAEVFHRRWGWWPMGAWLDEFERLGLAHLDAGTWVRRETDALS